VIKITEAHDLRDAFFAGLMADEGDKSEYAAQHDVWPCVLKGAAERWLRARGETFPPSKSSVLYFLRGKSAEAIITKSDEEQEMTVYKGVSCHPDLNRDDLERLFPGLMDKYPDIKVAEIKSTNFSSLKFYEHVQKGGVDFALDGAFSMRNYFEQTGNYLVATGGLEPGGSRRALLIVFFLHGDYADRRTKCPFDKANMGPWVDDFYRQCPKCGYKSKKLDAWIYTLEYDRSDLEKIDRDVFGTRVGQFYAAVSAEDEAGVRKAAPATPCFYCRSCKVGERIGCANAGIEFD